MKTVNSLSGGKTSSYIGVHYPADYDVFALCCIDSHNAGRQIDRQTRQRVNDRLEKHCPQYGEFVATSEDPKVLTTVFDLEQKIGREIIWLRGDSWETMIAEKKAIPNKGMRFCTTVMKIKPIFEFLYLQGVLPVEMRIGFRYDEMERTEKFSTTFQYATHCEYQEKSNRWIHRWKDLEWRVGRFPLIEDKILHYHIKQYWQQHQDIDFPEDSNCLNCYWKPFQQLRKNFDSHPEIMQWSKIMEDMMERRFKKEHSFHEIQRMGIQEEFVFGTGAGCQAGFCVG